MHVVYIAVQMQTTRERDHNFEKSVHRAANTKSVINKSARVENGDKPEADRVHENSPDVEMSRK